MEEEDGGLLGPAVSTRGDMGLLGQDEDEEAEDEYQ